MQNLPNEQVERFLTEIQMIDDQKYEIVQALRQKVYDLCPDVNEKIKYGGIMLSRQEDFGGIFAYKNHISFEFGQGIQMNDPDNLLEGAGKYRRHLKIKTLEDISLKKVEFYVKQAIAFLE